MVFFTLNYNQLLMYGVHVGHSLSNTLLYSAWMISAFRKSISIINLFKSLTMFRISFLIISNIIALHNPIWFINLDKSTEHYVKQAALNCGELPITSRWIRGSISNYNTVFNAYKRLMKLSGIILSSKNKRFSSFFNNWYLSRYSWPRIIFISNINTSYYPSIEAMSLKIPSISIVDTDTWTQASSIAIPGNDESLGCLVFYNDIISGFILSRKFNLISLWFFNVRSISRITDFIDWVSNRYSITTEYNLKRFVTFKANNINNYFKSFGLFLSKGKLLTTGSSYLNIFYSKYSFVNISQYFSIFFQSRNTIIMTLNFHFLKRIWLFKKFVKLNQYTNLNFKSRFLQKNYFTRQFISQRYLKFILLPTNLNIDFFVAITNLYFLQKYLDRIYLPGRYSPKLRYWNIISNIVVNKFTSKLKIFRNIKSHISMFPKKNINKKSNNLKFKIYNDWILLSKPNKLNFFLSNTSFDSYVPRYLWYWNMNYFLPKFNELNPILMGFFFKKISKDRRYFYGYLANGVNKQVFSKYENVKWYWF